MTKRKLLNILIILGLILLGMYLFVNSNTYSGWTINSSPFNGSDSYWQMIVLRYDGLFIPTIEDIEIIVDDKVIYKPQIDKTHHTNYYSKETFEEYSADGLFEFVDPKGYNLKRRGTSISIGINRDIINSYRGPRYIRIKFSDPLGEHIRDVRFP